MDINLYLRWSAMVLTVSGAALTSMQIDPYNIILLNSGSLCYLIWSVRIKERSIMFLHLGLMSVYAIGGLYRMFN